MRRAQSSLKTMGSPAAPVREPGYALSGTRAAIRSGARENPVEDYAGTHGAAGRRTPGNKQHITPCRTGRARPAARLARSSPPRSAVTGSNFPLPAAPAALTAPDQQRNPVHARRLDKLPLTMVLTAYVTSGGFLDHGVSGRGGWFVLWAVRGRPWRLLAGWLAFRPDQAMEILADPAGCEFPALAAAFPALPVVFGNGPGQPQLGDRGDDGPGPARYLSRVAECGLVPAQGGLGEPTGAFDIEAVQACEADADISLGAYSRPRAVSAETPMPPGDLIARHQDLRSLAASLLARNASRIAGP